MKSIKCNQNSISAKAILRLVFLFCALFAGVGSVWGQTTTISGSNHGVLTLAGWGNPSLYVLTEDVVCTGLVINENAKIDLNGYTLTVNGNVSTGGNPWGGNIGINIPSNSALVVTGTISKTAGNPSINGFGHLYCPGPINWLVSLPDGCQHSNLPPTDAPTLRVTPNSILDLGYIPGAANSPAQKITVTGANLTSNIIVTAPVGFEVATSSGGVFSSSVEISNTGGDVWVRLAPDASVGNYSGSLTLSNATENLPTPPTVALNASVKICDGRFTVISHWANGEISNICAMEPCGKIYEVDFSKAGKDYHFEIQENETSLKDMFSLVGYCNNNDCSNGQYRFKPENGVTKIYIDTRTTPYSVTSSLPASMPICTSLDVIDIPEKFSACQNSDLTTTQQTVTVKASELSDNVTVTPSAGYEISIDGSNWISATTPTQSVTIEKTGSYEQVVYVRMIETTSVTAVKPVTLTFATNGLSNQVITIPGEVTAPVFSTIEPITFSTECAGTTLSKTITLQGSCITTAPTIKGGENYEILPTIISAENLGDLNNEGIKITVTRSGAADSFSDETALIINDDVAVKASATVTKPSISITVKDLSAESFDYAECGTPSSKTFEIKTMCITGDITLSELTNFTASISGSNVTVALKKDLAKGSYSETLTISVGGIEETIELSGAVTEKETPNYTTIYNDATSNSGLTNCGTGCNASTIFSFKGTGYNALVSIKEGEIQLTSSNTNYSVDYRSDWNNYFGSDKGAYNGKTVFVRVTKKPSNAKPYTLEFQFANEDGSSPFDCGPSVSTGEIVFDKVCPGETYAAKTVTITGSSLTGDLTITEKTGYKVSPTSLTPNSDGSLNAAVTVTRNTPAGTVFFEDEDAFTISGGGLPADVTVKASGKVSATVITLDINNTPVTFPAICPNGTWTRESFEITKLGCPEGETTATISGDFRIYDAATGGNEVSNLAVGTKYWIEPTNNSTAGKKEGPINVTNNGVLETIDVSAEVIDGATLSHTAGEGLEFTTVCAIEDFETLSFKVKGVCLSDDITITAPEGFQVSTNRSTWVDKLTGISQDTETTVYVKPTISAAGTTASAELTISSGTATELKIPVTAAISEPDFTLTKNNNPADYWLVGGGPGEAGRIVVNGTCYTNSLSVSICDNNADNFEFSIDEGTTWVAANAAQTLTLNNNVGNILVRLKKGLTTKATHTANVCVDNKKIAITASVRDMTVRYAAASGDWCSKTGVWSDDCKGETTAEAFYPGQSGANEDAENVDVIVCPGVKLTMNCDSYLNIKGDITIYEEAELIISQGSNKRLEVPITVLEGGKLTITTDVILNNTIESHGTITLHSTTKIGNDLNLTANQDVLNAGNVTMMDSGFDDAMASIEVIGGDLKIGTLNAAKNITGSGVFKADNINIAQYGNDAGDGRISVFLKGETVIEKVSGGHKFDDNSIVFSDGNLTFNTQFSAGGDGKKWDIISPTNNDLTFKEGLTINKNPLGIDIGNGNLHLPKGVKVENVDGGSENDPIKLAWYAATTYIGGTLDNTNNYTRIHIVGDVQQTDNAILNAQNIGASWLIHGNFNKPTQEQDRILCGEGVDKPAYTLLIQANASIVNTIWIANDMYANIVNDSHLANYAMMAIKGNAYLKGATPGAEFEIKESMGLFIDGILVLDGLKIGFHNAIDNQHVYTPKHSEEELTNHFNEIAALVSCACTTNVKHKDEEFDDATNPANPNNHPVKEIDLNHYISLCDGQVKQNEFKEGKGVDGVGNGTDYGYGIADTPAQGSPAMPLDPKTEQETPFPIELTTFTAERVGAVVELNWATQTETNNDFFSVQRSSNGANFETIAEETGAGTTVIPQHYNHVDYSPLGGTSYYRLKQTDYDGAYSYSSIVPVHFASNGKTFEVLKTTKNNTTRLECIFANAAIANQITIHSITGRLEFETEVAPQNNPYVVELPLAPGVYLISNLNIEGKTVVKVMVTN